MYKVSRLMLILAVFATLYCLLALAALAVQAGGLIYFGIGIVVLALRQAQIRRTDGLRNGTICQW